MLGSGVSSRDVAMLSDGLGPLLKSALQQLELSRDALASKTGVSMRLVAEIRGTAAARLERAARAAHRRETWTGRHVHLRDSGDAPRPPRSLSRRIASVAAISETAYHIASSGGKRPAVSGKKRARG